MGDNRRFDAKRAIDQEMSRRRWEPLVAAKDVADLHHLVVDNVGQRVDGIAVRLQQYKVVDRREVEARWAVDGIVEGDLAARWRFEAHDSASALGLSFLSRGSSPVLTAATPVIAWWLPVARLLRA